MTASPGVERGAVARQLHPSELSPAPSPPAPPEPEPPAAPVDPPDPLVVAPWLNVPDEPPPDPPSPLLPGTHWPSVQT